MALRHYVAFFGVFDVVFSLTILCCTVIYVATCKADDTTSFITSKTTVEHWKFFMDALKSCEYIDESRVPAPGMICKQLASKVLPHVIISTSLNFLVGIFMQIIARDKYFLLEDSKGKKTKNSRRLHSLGFIPFGILIEMSFVSLSLLQYTDSRFCWLSYNIQDMTYSYTRTIMIVIGFLLVLLYKPAELAVYFAYACRLVDVNELSVNRSATCNLAAQLGSNEDQKPGPSKNTQKVTLDETDKGVPVLKYDAESRKVNE